LEDCHFLREKHPADAVGWKCLARAVSDIAAMGGQPRCFLLSLALPRELAGSWFDGFLLGLRRASTALGCELAGGDTTRRDKALIHITVIGEVRRRALLRSGARTGDAIFVSGTLGEAELGLRQLLHKQGIARRANQELRKHLYPQPRLALGRWLRDRQLATAAMDLSDGLSSDLRRLCLASGVGARIDFRSLPVTGRVPPDEARRLGLHGGDDYELLFTVAKKNLGKMPTQFGGVKLTRIGEITRSRPMVVDDAGKLQKLEARGWDPFRS
jgi:thiamine-monophosphate kinase